MTYPPWSEYPALSKRLLVRSPVVQPVPVQSPKCVSAGSALSIALVKSPGFCRLPVLLYAAHRAFLRSRDPLWRLDSGHETLPTCGEEIVIAETGREFGHNPDCPKNHERK